MKIHQDIAGHLTKLAAMLYMVKQFKIFFPGAAGLIFDETLYEASETKAVYILFKL